MPQSISNYITISVALEGAGVQAAGFGTPIFVSDHVVTANRLDGPYTSLAAMVTAGFISTTPEYLWAASVFAQQPRVQRVYIGRRAVGDANLAASLDAILAVDPGAWYAINMESRSDADIVALAAWVESASFPKIAIAQSDALSLIEGEGPRFNALFEGTVADGTYILTFAGFGLGAPVTVTTTRTAGTPATLALVGDAFRTQLTTQFGTNLAGVLAAAPAGTGATVTFQILPGLAPGTVVASGTAVASTADLTVTIPDAAVGQTLFAANYTRTALLYHGTDAEYLDGAWTSRCLSFNLDQQKGAWSFKRIAGIAGDQLDDVQVANLRAVNANYFAPAVMSSGVAVQAFTAQGWMPAGDAAAGRRIDVTTSIDWLRARLEEATASVLLRDPNDVPFTDAGINRFYAAWTGVFQVGLAAGHLVAFVVPEGEDLEGERTPYLDVPALSETTTAQRVARTMSATGLVYLRSSIERVALAIEARQ